MNHVRVITITGQEVEITLEEAHRIADSMHPKMDPFHQKVAERNLHYHKKAQRNISEIASRHGFSGLDGTENEYKALISCMLGDDDDLGDLIVEIVEERIAHHHKEIYSE
jgi:hypothetical protein